MEHRFAPAFVAWMRVMSTRQSPRKCRLKGVGGMIEELRTMVPDNGAGDFVLGAKEDLRMLETFCQSCRRCGDKMP